MVPFPSDEETKLYWDDVYRDKLLKKVYEQCWVQPQAQYNGRSIVQYFAASVQSLYNIHSDAENDIHQPTLIETIKEDLEDLSQIFEKRQVEKLLEHYSVGQNEMINDLSCRNAIHDLLDFDNQKMVMFNMVHFIKHVLTYRDDSKSSVEILQSVFTRLMMLRETPSILTSIISVEPGTSFGIIHQIKSQGLPSTQPKKSMVRMVKSIGNFNTDTNSYVEQLREIFDEGKKKVHDKKVEYFLADFTLSFLHSGPLQKHFD